MLRASKGPQHRILVPLVTQPAPWFPLEPGELVLGHGPWQEPGMGWLQGCVAVCRLCALPTDTQRRGTWELKPSLRLCLLSVWSGVGLDSNPSEEVSFSDLLKAVFGLAVTRDGCFLLARRWDLGGSQPGWRPGPGSAPWAPHKSGSAGATSPGHMGSPGAVSPHPGLPGTPGHTPLP